MACFGHPCFPIISKSATIALYKGDVGTDIYSAVQYLEQGHEWWGYLTITFIVCPMILVAPLLSVFVCGKGHLCWGLFSIICFPLAPVMILYWNLIVAVKHCRRHITGSKDNDSNSATNKGNDRNNDSNNSYPDTNATNNDQCSVPLSTSSPGDFAPSAPGPGDFVPSAPGPGDFVPSAPGPGDFIPSAPLLRGPDTDNIDKVSNDSIPDNVHAITITTPLTLVPKQVSDNDNSNNSSINSCPDNKSTASNEKINSDTKDTPDVSTVSTPYDDHVLTDAYMKIVDSVTESLPQSSLAMHIIFQTVEKHGLEEVAYFQWITLTFSIVSLAFSLTTNFAFDDGSSVKGRAVKFLLCLPAITCRLLVCSTYSAVHPGYWFIPIGTEVVIWIFISCCGLLGNTAAMAVSSSVYIWYAIGGLYIALPRIITITSLVLNIVMAIIQLFISTLLKN